MLVEEAVRHPLADGRCPYRIPDLVVGQQEAIDDVRGDELLNE